MALLALNSGAVMFVYHEETEHWQEQVLQFLI